MRDADMTEGSRPTPWGLIASIAVAVLVVGGALIVAMSMGGSDPAVLGDVPGGAGASTPANPLLSTSNLVGQPAPTTDFETFDGGTASFADYRGKPLVVNFFSSTCVPCLTEMPDLEEVKQSHDGDVTFLGMNVADSIAAGQSVVDRTGVTWDLGRDPTGELLQTLGGIGLPTTVIIDAEGSVVYLHTGQLSAEDLESELAPVL